MIIVAELAINDGAHVPFNAGLLEVVRNAFPDRRLYFFGAPAHIDSLRNQVGKALIKSIEWMDLLPLAPDLPYFWRLFREMKRLRTILEHFPQGARGPLILANSKPAALVALKLIKSVQFKEIRVQIVLHGQLGGIIGRRYRHPVRRFQEARTALTILGNNHLQYLVLEANLRDVLLQHLPVLSEKVQVLHHPLPPNEIETRPGGLGTPVRFGFLGLASIPKGFPVFANLAHEICSTCKEQAEFHVIGRIPQEGISSLKLEALATKPSKDRLSRNDYVLGLDQLDFIIFPHQESNYELNASGTLVDALAWGKPLIARKIPLFENLFSRYGDIGYLFSQDTELSQIVQTIVQKADKAHYQQQVLNIQKARCCRTPEVLAVDYRKICEAF